jgi:quinol monooxygenase YgiN
MSVIVTQKFFGDTSAFRKSLDERADEYREFAASAKEQGAIHHQFAVGDGYVIAVDEWDSAEAFEKFANDPKLRAFIGEIGADPNRAPEISVGESIDSPDRL